MTDYTARNVLLKDSSGNYLIPYTEKADLSLGNLNSAGKAYVAIKGYDSTATYSLNEVVMTVVSGSVLFYRSLVDNNTASLSDTTKWSEVSFGSGANIDLSNLSSTGEAHFANPSLSNLTNGLANTICTTPATTTSTASYATPAVVVENYRNGASFYRKWSDGFIEQGGIAAAGYTSTVSFFVAFSSTNYVVEVTGIDNTSTGYIFSAYNRTTVNMILYTAPGGATANCAKSWYACGY